MTTTTDTAHEELARLRKAVALADILDALGWDADDCEHASPEMWNLAAAVANVRKPSDSTAAVVADLIRQRRRAREAVLNAARASANA